MIALASSLALAGCSSGSLNTGSDTATKKANITVGKTGVQSDIGSITKYCGTKPITVALADGFGGNSWRKITKQVFIEDAKKCKNIKKVLYTDAQGDTQKAISDINSLVAQKVDVIVTFVDGGQALLPTIKKATAAGVKVVPYVGSPGGTPGKDYTDFVAEDIKTYGENLANWTIKAMGGKGNLVMLGGIAGNSYSQGVFDGVVAAAKKNPGIKLLDADAPVATDWEPGKTQQVVAGLITKYGQIDGIVSDYGGGSVGGVRAFIAANKPIPPWSANDSNSFSCLWYQYKDSQPRYQIATESSRNWVVQEALNKGLAAFNGIDNTEPSIFNLQIIEDSTDPSKQPNCQKDLPDDAILSSGLTVPQLKDLFK
ncbi:MAG: transporter substrate-binding protein [Microbacteriaceae bacterium]|jgi:ribose transport system substrate-binding protein|nr:transporter substrate-binding protein [Microbacteriaceae bacterium]